MQIQERKVHRLIEPAVTAFGYELLGVQMLRAGASPTLRVYIDKHEGITLDDCELVSQHVSGVLDVEDPIPGQYALEVSSPGLDRPLFSERHFTEHVGENIKIKLHAPHQGRRKLKGEILGFSEGNVQIQEETGDGWEIPLELIAVARLIPADV